jgi:SNF2 family DNA or RNA helicase
LGDPLLTIDLHDYQSEDADRILASGNMLLAYTMGVGKTITSIAVAEELLGNGEIEQVLIIVPAGLKLQWASAIAKRTDVATQTLTVKGETFLIPEDRYCVVVDGTPARRQEQYELIQELQPNYVIVGYQTVVSDLKLIRRKLAPGLIIADEITLLKNPSADVTKAVRKLDAPRKLGLTGTPVDNMLEGVFQIMKWIDQDILGDWRHFDQAYIVRDHWGGVKRYRNLPVLHKKLAPAMIRRTSTDPDVARYMPTLLSSTLTVSMDPRTARVYRSILVDLERELAELAPGTSFDLGAHYSGEGQDTPAGRVMAVHLAAEQLLTDPELLFDSDSRYARQLVESGALEGLPRSAKLRKLEEEVDSLLDDPSNKIIVVTRFRKMVEKLVNRWSHLSVAYHGSLSPAEKQAAVNRFELVMGTPVFVMSHAGAFGVDLPSANHMYLLDSPRSAGQEAQMTHRHVRSGSPHKNVNVTHLVTIGTVEERTRARLDLRRRVASAAIDGKGADATGRIEDDVESLTSHIDAVLTAGSDSL